MSRSIRLWGSLEILSGKKLLHKVKKMTKFVKIPFTGNQIELKPEKLATITKVLLKELSQWTLMMVNHLENMYQC